MRSFAWTPQRARVRRIVRDFMNPAHADPRRDDTATARETTCPDCGGDGTVTTRIVSSIDPGAVREFYQTCSTCHGVGKVAAVMRERNGE